MQLRMNKVWCDRKAFVVLFSLMMCLSSCAPQSSKNTIINLSFTPWIGYYPFHFAIEKQIPQRYGVELRVLETLTVQDFRRTNLREHVHGFACSLMEASRVNSTMEEPLEIINLLNYSNGGDVVVARKSIASMQELEGKTIGFDWRSLTHYFLTLALKHENAEKMVFTHRQADQIVAAQYFEENKIDAYVSYPPSSTKLLENEQLHVIFDSSKIPFHIMDVLVLKKEHQDKREVLRYIWRDVIEYIAANTDEYEHFVVELMGIEPENVREVVAGIVFINEAMQNSIGEADVVELLQKGCEILGDEAAECIADLQKLSIAHLPAKH